MNILLQDLRYGLRTLRKSPAFALVAVLTIGIGIGANTTIFSWIRTMLLNPLPGAVDPSRIVAIENQAASGEPITSSFLDFRDYRDHLRRVENVTSVQQMALTVGDEHSSERMWGELVSGNFFDLLGIAPQTGRFFSKEERGDAQNTYAVAVISDAFWRARYRGNNAIGTTIRINRTPLTIIGVAPPEFHGTQPGFSYDVWVPITMYGQLTHTGTWMLRDRNTRNFTLMARLAPGSTVDAARSEAQALASFMAVADADTNKGVGATVLPYSKTNFGPRGALEKPLKILMAACAVLLLIVCANVGNLLLARATSRQKEFSIRLAMGARPARLARQLLTEALILATAGSFAGVIVASWLGGALRWLLPAVDTPTMLQPPLDGPVLAFTTAVAAVVALIAGVAPALDAAHSNVNDMMKEGGRSGASSAHSHRLRGLLVVSEVALAVVALIGAGLFLKSFQATRSMQTGFVPEGQVLAQFNLSTAGYTQQQADQFSQRLTAQLLRHPGITAVSYADTVPLGFQGGNWEGLAIDGYQPAPGENMNIQRNMIGPGYFDVMKIGMEEGRDFDLRDDAKSPKVMIVNEEFVHRFVPNGIVIGRKVRGWGEPFTIVGIVKNIKIHHVNERTEPFIYVPIRQIYRPEYGLTFHVRTNGPLPEALGAIRHEAAAIDPALTIFSAEPMSEYIAGSLFGQKIAATLLSVLGGLGLLLAAMGLYSVMSYSVAQRTAEIGIRVTLGAQPRDVLALIMRQGLSFTLWGLACGAIAAAALSRLASSALVAVSPADPWVYAGTALFTLLVASASAAIPAWRALRVDPMVALRN